jgi:hypothetical protein
MFYTNTRSPVKPIGGFLLSSRPVSQDGPDFFHRDSSNGTGEDFERAQQDRLGGGALVSIAYWLVRGVQLLFGAIARLTWARSRT